MKTRIIIWLTIAFLIPVLILIVYGEYQYFWWSAGVLALAAIYEFINWRQTRKL